MKHKKWGLILLSLLLGISLVVFVGCGSSDEGSVSEESGDDGQVADENNLEKEKYGGMDKLSIGASSVGSSSYTKIAVWSDYVGKTLNLNITPEGTAGSVANAQLTDAGEVEIGSTMMNIASEGYNGRGFSEGKKLENLRLMATLDSFVLQFYALEENGIKSIYDLEGKHVSLSKAGSGTDSWARRVFDELGIKPAKISNVSPTEANDLMRDGTLDAAGCMGSAHPAIIEMNSSHDLSIFGVGDGSEQFVKVYPELTKVTMNAGTYEGQEKPFVTVGEHGILVVHKDMPEDLVYDLVKATYEGKDEMAGGYPGFSTIDPEDIVLGTIPLHKGAYKYYKELGIDIPQTIMPID